MTLRNSAHSYGWLAILFHWLTAMVVIFLFGLGLYMVELSYYDAWYKDSLDLHKSIGLTLVIVWLARVIWKLLNPSVTALPSTRKHARLEQFVATFVHRLLYLLLPMLFISGFLISTADGRGIEVFALFEVPALPIAIDNQEDIAGDIHWILAWTLILVASGHALAALKHHFIDKDQTLMRMLKARD